MLTVMNMQTNLLFVDDALGYQCGPLEGVVIWTKLLPLVRVFPSVMSAKLACDILASRGYSVAVVSISIL